MPRLDGMDGSHYQPDAGPVDLFATAAIPTWWIAWKITQGVTGKDPSFPKMRVQAEAAGFTHKLAYHWLSSTKDPVDQANHFLNTMGDFGFWGAMLDAEELNTSEEYCLAWCETVEKRRRRPCAMYTGLYVTDGLIWKSKALRNSEYGPRPFDVAAYVSETNLMNRMVQTRSLPDFPFQAWQFSSNGPVAGITGRCDMNRVDDRNMYDRVCGLSEVPVPNPPTQEQDMSGTRRFVRDDRPGDEWQIWIQDVDDTLTEWAVAINGHPIPWDGYSDLVVPVKSYEFLKNLPHAPNVTVSGGTIGPMHGTWSTIGQTQ